jgi:hypothetical protein
MPAYMYNEDGTRKDKYKKGGSKGSGGNPFPEDDGDSYDLALSDLADMEEEVAEEGGADEEDMPSESRAPATEIAELRRRLDELEARVS